MLGEATALLATRSALRAWLHRLGVVEADGTRLEHAVGEVVTNAVEHASTHDAAAAVDARVTVRGVLTPDGTVHVEVTDQGRWVHRDHAGRGRGLTTRGGTRPATVDLSGVTHLAGAGVAVLHEFVDTGGARAVRAPRQSGRPDHDPDRAAAHDRARAPRAVTTPRAATSRGGDEQPPRTAWQRRLARSVPPPGQASLESSGRCASPAGTHLSFARRRSSSKSTSTAANAEMSSGRIRIPRRAMAVSMPRSK